MLMSLQNMSDEELGKHRTAIVLEITELNSRIGVASVEMLSVHKKERNEVAGERDRKSDTLRVIDAEFERRGLKPANL